MVKKTYTSGNPEGRTRHKYTPDYYYFSSEKSKGEGKHYIRLTDPVIGSRRVASIIWSRLSPDKKTKIIELYKELNAKQEAQEGIKYYHINPPPSQLYEKDRKNNFRKAFYEVMKERE